MKFFIDKPQRLSLIQIGYENQLHVRSKKDNINNDEEMKSLFSDNVFTVVFTCSTSLSHLFFKTQLCKSNVLTNAIPHVHKVSGICIHGFRIFLNLTELQDCPDNHYWFYDRLQAYLDQPHPGNSNFVTNKLIPYRLLYSCYIRGNV